MPGLQLEQLRDAVQAIENSARALTSLRPAGSQDAALSAARVKATGEGLLPAGAEVEAGNTDPEQDLRGVELRELQDLRDHLKGQVQANPDFFGAQGGDLYAGLSEVVARFHGPQPLGREQRMLQEAVRTHVSGVFGDLMADNEGRTRLMDNYRNNIDQRMERVRNISDQLASEEVLPTRLEQERHRATLVFELSELHQKRARSVSEPSRVPGLLREKLQEFQAQHAERLAELGRLQRKHDDLAFQARSTAMKQAAYRNSVMERCRQEEEAARGQEECSMSQAHDALALIVDTSRRLCNLLEKAKRAHDLAEEKAEERTVAQGLLDEAIGFQERIEAGNLTLSQRFLSGRNLMHSFAEWLQDAYGWMERAMAEKRAALEAQMPEEKENFRALLAGLGEDAMRRREQMQWAMADVVQKRDEQLKEAKSLEQVGSRRAKERVASLKLELEEVDEELQDMQAGYDRLKGLQEQLQSKCSEMLGARASSPSAFITRSFSTRALDWVKSFFHNREHSQARYVPPALFDLMRSVEGQSNASQRQGPLSWIRHRITGKRPSSELEGPPSKVLRRLPLLA